MSKPRRKKRETPMAPGYEGRMELGKRNVDDPLERGAKLEVTVNNRRSPLEYWRAQGDIDDAQFYAGEKFANLYEAHILGGGKAIDYAAPCVDTSGKSDPISDRQMDAEKELRGVEVELGTRPYRLLALVCGQGLWPKDLARSQGGGTERESREIGQTVRGHLDKLARFWSMA